MEKEKSFTPIRVPAGQGVQGAQQPRRPLQFFLILHPYRYARLCTIYPGGEGGDSRSKTPSPVCLISVNEIYNAKQKKSAGGRWGPKQIYVCGKVKYVGGGGAQSHVRYLTMLKSTPGPRQSYLNWVGPSKIIIHNNVYRFHCTNIRGSDRLSV